MDGESVTAGNCPRSVPASLSAGVAGAPAADSVTLFNLLLELWAELERQATLALGNVDAAQDVLQETAVSVLEQDKIERPRNQAKALLRTIHRRRIMDWWRSWFRNEKTKCRIASVSTHLPDAILDSPFSAQNVELLEDVFRVLGKTRVFEAFVLHRLREMPRDQVAEQMGITPRAVTTYCWRATQLLRKYLEDSV